MIGFLGFGNMGMGLAKGMLRSAALSPMEIGASSAHFDTLQSRAKTLGILAYPDNLSLVKASDWVILAVKPNKAAPVLRELGESLRGKIVCSLVANLHFDALDALLPEDTPHISILPNTPVEVGRGVICYENKHSLNEIQWKKLRELLSPCGLMTGVDSSLLGIAGTVTGCGPALTALYLEAMSDAAVKHGLPRELAYTLVSEMVAGTATLRNAKSLHPGVLKDAVCSPGGTTIRGVTQLEKDGFRGNVINAMDAIMEFSEKK